MKRFKITTLNSIYEVRVSRDPVVDKETTEFRCLAAREGSYAEKFVGDYWYKVKTVYFERRLGRETDWWPIEVVPLDEETNWPYSSRYLRTSSVTSVEELDA